MKYTQHMHNAKSCQNSVYRNTFQKLLFSVSLRRSAHLLHTTQHDALLRSSALAVIKTPEASLRAKSRIVLLGFCYCSFKRFEINVTDAIDVYWSDKKRAKHAQNKLSPLMNWLGTSVAGGNAAGAGAYPTRAVAGVAGVATVAGCVSFFGERSPLSTQARIARSAPLKAVGLLWSQQDMFHLSERTKRLTWSWFVVQLHIG